MPRDMVTAMTPQRNLSSALAEIVISLRHEARVSRQALAEQAGMAERTLARRESGRSAWTTDEMAAIAGALGIEAYDLIRKVLDAEISPAA